MMQTIEKFNKKEIIEILNLGWMTHDSMWMRAAIDELGIDTANKLNIAAVSKMAMIEARRMKKFLGLKKIETFEEWKTFLQESFGLIMPEFMKFSYSFPKKNYLNFSWNTGECFAYKGMNKNGLLEHYRCGIIKRIEGWYKGLNIEYTLDPHIDKCQLLTQSKCLSTFISNLR